MARRKRVDPEETRLRKELYGAILSLLVRLIGETVKDRMFRTLLVSMVGAFGYYYDIGTVEVDLNAPTPQQVVQSK